METIDLHALVREKTGGRTPGRLRKEGIIPGVVYGKMKEPIHVQVERGAFARALHTSAGENVVLNLKLNNSKKAAVTVILKDMQHHIINDKVEHIDFQEISLTDKIQVKVHVQPKGEAAGVQQGGVLDVIHHEISIECLPTQIPEKLTIDISELQIGDSLHIKDLTFPEGVECLDDLEDVLLVVHAPKVETEEEAEEEALEGEEASAEPEVIKKGKEEKEEEA